MRETAGLAIRSRAFFSAREARIAVLLVLLAFGLTLAAGSDRASAEVSRPLLKTLKYADNDIPKAVATDKAGNIYIAVMNFSSGYHRIEKFDSEGNPLDFAAAGTKPYIVGNAITETGDGRPIDFDSGQPGDMEVDRTSGPTEGFIYVNAVFVGANYAFKPNGEFAGSFDASGLFPCAISQDRTTGDLHMSYGAYNNTIRRYAATTEPLGPFPNGTLNTPEPNNCGLAVDSGGNLYALPGEYNGGPTFKYPADSFGPSPSPREEIYGGPTYAIAYNQATGNLIASRNTDLIEMTTAGVQVNAPFGSFFGNNNVTDAPGDRVIAQGYAGNPSFYAGTVSLFGPPANLPKVSTGSPEALQTAATLHGNVDPDGAGTITNCEFEWGKDARYQGGTLPCSPAGSISSPTAVSAELSGLSKTSFYRYRLVTTSANGVQAGNDVGFTTPDNVADVQTGDADPVTKDSAMLHGSYRGQGLDTDYYFEVGKDTEYGLKFPASPVNAGVENGPQQLDPIQATGLMGGTEYQYRLVMENSLGVAYGQNRAFVTPLSVADVETGDATNVSNESAELNGSFTADSYETKYFFEWGPTTAYGNNTPAPPGNTVAPGSGKVDVPPVLLDPIQEGGIYHYRLVAHNSAGFTYGQDRVFKTAEPPQVSNLASKNVKTDSADLTAEINPNRGETSWFFEWGQTTEYGNKAPVPAGTIAPGSDPVPVLVHLENLQVGLTYQFRLVASNQFGIRRTGNQSFGFYPPPCPNSQARQETNASHTPDCRGYELVSPGNANGATIEPLNAPSVPVTTSPPRLGYGASYGELPGASEALISVGDLYVAERTPTAWRSRYVGKNARETTFMAGPPHGGVMGTTNYGGNNTYFGAVADPTYSRVVLFDFGYPAFWEIIDPPSNVAHVFDTTTNKQLEHWPTNLDEVPGGKDFVGWQAFSEDLTHFVFSSNVSFADGGEAFPDAIECCSYNFGEFEAGRCCPGPIYDNDTETGEIGLISEREDGTRFQGVPLKVSGDGSHVLMSETADALIDIPRPLYMRVGGQTYDIADRASLEYVDMTADGSTVYFTAKSQLVLGDEDESVDMYVWSEDSPNTVTLVSKGATGNEGNRDDCKLGWIENCDIQVIEVSNPVIPGQSNGNGTGNQTTDSPVGKEAGDIYFVSAEQLDGARGSFGQANVYLFHDGGLRFVVSAEPESCIGRRPFLTDNGNCEAGKISRMQVTPNGEFAAFISKSRLTPYDNNGKAEMYLYDREQNRLDCASCRPDGLPPSFDAYGSQNGLFLTVDGRAFFSTDEAIAPSDTNKGNDVYEFVEGKPQLISTGTAEPGATSGFQGVLTAPGLVSVSSDGVDVFFTTQESLVTQDRNGEQIKIYDARTNGGFPADRVEPECEAADECHGPDSSAPLLPKDRTSVVLEGNPKHKAKKKSKKSKKKAKKKKTKKKRADRGKRGGRHAG
jgi:hypothetical protein